MGGQSGSKRSRDFRVRQTQSAILDSFNELVLGRPYESIGVPVILAEAGVGRSTFYEHFRNKDELLKHAAKEILEVLADAAVATGDPSALTHACHHFHANRATVRDLLTPPSGQTLTRFLAELIESRLNSLCKSRVLTLPVPARLVAAQVAAGQIAMVREWVDALSPVAPETLAHAIRATSQGAIAPLLATATS